MVSTEEEKVPHVDEAEEFATAINHKSIIMYLSEIIIPGTYFNQDYCNKSVYLLRQLLPLRLQQMNQRLA